MALVIVGRLSGVLEHGIARIEEVNRVVEILESIGVRTKWIAHNSIQLTPPETFKLENINTSPAIFDERKLLWMNGEFIRKTSDPDLKRLISEFDPEISKKENFEQYLSLAKTRMKTLADFRTLVENQKVVLNQEQKRLGQELIATYRKLPEWEPTLISTATIAVRDQVGASTQDVYTVLTGRPQGLPFEQKLGIQGQGGTISWLEEMLKNK